MSTCMHMNIRIPTPSFLNVNTASRAPASTIAIPHVSLVSGAIGSRRQGVRRRGDALLTRAVGPPSTSTLLLVFFLPLSLFVGTVLVSIRVADKLDEQYLEELAMNQAIMEEKEAAAAAAAGGGEEDENGAVSEEGPKEEEEEKVVARNRPKRQQA